MSAALQSMLDRTLAALPKFAAGTSQHTLLSNRIRALEVAQALVEGKDNITITDLKAAKAPLLSLLSKSEKARTKLKETTWQHRMLTVNIDALRTVLPLMEERLNAD